MTDGIIQKWVNKYHNERLTCMITNELIEMIKQEYMKWDSEISTELVIKLIGDNNV